MQGVFFKFSTLFVVLTFQIIYQYSLAGKGQHKEKWTWYDIWNLLAVNVKDKPFHSSIDWSGLYLQVFIPPWLGNIFRFTVFTLLKNAFVKLSPWHDLIISTPMWNTTPHRFSQKSLSPCRKLVLRGTLWATSDWMFRNRFELILWNLHLCDNEQLDK